MLLKANMTIKSVSPPVTYWCKSGHKAKEDVPFFHISGDTLATHLWGVYCEDCLKAANERSAQLKEEKRLYQS